MKNDFKEELISKVVRVFKLKGIEKTRTELDLKTTDELQEMLKPNSVRDNLINEIKELRIKLGKKQVSSEEFIGHDVGVLRTLRDVLRDESKEKSDD